MITSNTKPMVSHLEDTFGWRILFTRSILLGILGLGVFSRCSAEEPAPPPQPGKTITMNFKDTPLETILDQLSEMTGLS